MDAPKKKRTPCLPTNEQAAAIDGLDAAFLAAWKLALEDPRVAGWLAGRMDRMLSMTAGACAGHCPRFIKAASAFRDARNPSTSGRGGVGEDFLETWLKIGVAKTQGYLFPWPTPTVAMHAAAGLLEQQFGPEWQDAEPVKKVFAIPGHSYSRPNGPHKWDGLLSGDKREVVKKMLLAAAKRIARRDKKFDADFS